MTKQQQIKAELLKLDSNLKTAEQIDENIKIQDYTTELNQLEIINFLFSFRSNECQGEGSGDYWLQCEYYSEKLKKTIIFDYDVCQYYTHNDDNTITALDDFVSVLADYHDRVAVFESKIVFNS